MMGVFNPRMPLRIADSALPRATGRLLRLASLALSLLFAPGVAAEEILCGDTDGDGLFETEDIQQCLDALQGGPPHVVRLIEDQVFEPHFSAPPFYNPIGLVELESDTTLDCQGSMIRGVDDVAKRAPNAWGSLWVVTNSNHVSNTQSDIWVRNCEIDGGMPASYNETSDPFDNDIYMGFALYGVARGGIVDSYVHDTHHSCVYIRNSQDVGVDDNQFQDCGGASNAGSFGQPAVYLFQAGSTAQERISVRRNTALRSGAAMYNTRISEGNPEFQTTWMRDVLFEDNFGDQDGSPHPCVYLRGVRGVVVRNNTCVNSLGIFTSSLSTGFCSDNPPVPVDAFAESNCLEDVLIEDNVISNTQSAGATGGINLYDYHDGVTVRRNRVTGTTRLAGSPVPCLRWQTPMRDFEIDGLCALGCADAGIEQHPVSPDQIGVPANEQVVLRDVVVQTAGAEGMVLRKRLEGLTVHQLAVRDALGDAFLSLGELVAPTLTGFDLDPGPLPVWAHQVCSPPVPIFSIGTMRLLLLPVLIAVGSLAIRRATLRSR